MQAKEDPAPTGKPDSTVGATTSKVPATPGIGTENVVDTVGGALSNNSDEEDLAAEEVERPVRRKRRVKGQKICGVCGDVAQSHNFGALTCETCKAFFRRNARKQKDLQACVHGGTCTVTKATRRFCATCRLAKCYSIGMDAELILNEDERKERQRKRESTSARRQLQNQCTEPIPSSSTNPVVTTFKTESIDSAETIAPPIVPKTETGVDKGSNYLADGAAPCVCSCHQKAALGLNFERLAPDGLPEGDHLYWALTPHEASLLEYFCKSYKEIFCLDLPMAGKNVLSIKDLPVEKVMIAVDLLLRKFIMFSKRVPEFRQLLEVDQITLLKTTAMRLYCIRLAETYVLDRKSWKTGVGEVSEDEVAHLFREPDILKQIVEFSEGVKYVLSSDYTIYGLLLVLVLFDPRDPSLQNRVFVNNQKDKYMVMLKHYLESHFSFLHAGRYLAEIMNVLLDVDHLGQKLLVFFNDYSSHFYPLISEFLNQ